MRAEYKSENRLAAQALHGRKKLLYNSLIRQIPAPSKAEVGELVSRKGARAHQARDVGFALGLLLYVAAATMCVLSIHAHQETPKDVHACVLIFVQTGWSVVVFRLVALPFTTVLMPKVVNRAMGIDKLAASARQAVDASQRAALDLENSRSSGARPASANTSGSFGMTHSSSFGSNSGMSIVNTSQSIEMGSPRPKRSPSEISHTARLARTHAWIHDTSPFALLAAHVALFGELERLTLVLPSSVRSCLARREASSSSTSTANRSSVCTP